VELAGALTNWAAPQGAFDVKSHVALAELGDVLRVPVEHRGEADFEGKVNVVFTPKFEYDIRGRLQAKGLAYRANGIEIAGIALKADSEVTPRGVNLPRVTATGLDGQFQGKASLPDFKRFVVDGDASGFSIG